ncbi:ammonium transporter [Streptomyces thioluteus]|uniref:Ammonium transporter n=1 Tax=Streptomyces thioluteus TaxID=66431 RepID=A0ABN3WW50_STRTU
MNAADTAFVLISAALVMLMTPGLAFFYGGMVRVKSALNMLMMSFVSLGIVTVLWVLFGYSLAFGDDIGGGLLGNLDHIGLKGIRPDTLTGGKEGIPVFAFVLFQLMFAVLALMSGALADRVKSAPGACSSTLWVTVVYFPVAHWVWQPDGWLFKLKVIRLRRGTAVHIKRRVGGARRPPRRRQAHRPPQGPHAPPQPPAGDAGAGCSGFGVVRLQRALRARRQRQSPPRTLALQHPGRHRRRHASAGSPTTRVRHGARSTPSAPLRAVDGLSPSPLGAVERCVNALSLLPPNITGAAPPSACRKHRSKSRLKLLGGSRGLKFRLGYERFPLRRVGAPPLGGTYSAPSCVGSSPTEMASLGAASSRQAAGAFAVLAYSSPSRGMHYAKLVGPATSASAHA